MTHSDLKNSVLKKGGGSKGRSRETSLGGCCNGGRDLD